jgi:hypothetical protein
MVRDARALLWDAHTSGTAIARLLFGKSLSDFLADAMLRSAVGRPFEILGDAPQQVSGTCQLGLKSVVVAADRKDIDMSIVKLIDEPVLSAKPPRPKAGKIVSK